MIGEAFAYPTNSDGNFKRFGIAYLMILLSFLLVPGIVLLGYIMQAMRQSSRGKPTPPTWADPFALLASGCRGLVVMLVYGFVALLPIIAGAFMLPLGTTSGIETSAASLDTVFLLAALIFILFIFVLQYFLPAVLANVAYKDNVAAGFELRTIADIAISKQYAIAAIITVVLSLAFGLMVQLFVMVTLGLGLFFLPVVYFWMYLVYAYIFGTVYGDQRDIEQEFESETDRVTP